MSVNLQATHHGGNNLTDLGTHAACVKAKSLRVQQLFIIPRFLSMVINTSLTGIIDNDYCDLHLTNIVSLTLISH